MSASATPAHLHLQPAASSASAAPARLHPQPAAAAASAAPARLHLQPAAAAASATPARQHLHLRTWRILNPQHFYGRHISPRLDVVHEGLDLYDRTSMITVHEANVLVWLDVKICSDGMIEYCACKP